MTLMVSSPGFALRCAVTISMLTPFAANGQSYCNKTDFRSCVREIVRVDAILKKRSESGYMGNVGNSLVSCYVECIGLHFPSEGPAECTTARKRLAEGAAQSPALARGFAATAVWERCGQR